MFFSDSVIIDTSPVSSVVNQINFDFSSWVSVVLPYLLAIVGCFLIFLLIRFSIRLVRRFVASTDDSTFTTSDGVKYTLGSNSSF